MGEEKDKNVNGGCECSIKIPLHKGCSKRNMLYS